MVNETVTKMVEIDIDVEVWCDCGEGLCGQTTSSLKDDAFISLVVEPCEKCLEAKYEEGRDTGAESAGSDLDTARENHADEIKNLEQEIQILKTSLDNSEIMISDLNEDVEKLTILNLRG